MNRVSAIFSLFLGCVCYSTFCCAGWYDAHEQGWYWYKDPIEEPTKKIEGARQKENKKTQTQAMKTYAERMEEYRKEGEELRAKSILERTPESISAVMTWDNNMWNMVEEYVEIWEEVQRRRPDLDYSVQYPTAQYVRHLYQQQQQEKKEQALNAFKNQYGLVFFFKGSCPYCHAMAPLVAGLAEKYGLEMHPVSIDGGMLDEFRRARIDPGLAEKFAVYQVPALYAVDPRTGESLPIVTGAVSEQEIEERIWSLAQYLDHHQENKERDTSEY